uniref:Uncharacterized protein n=1 Tax=Cannabis sativa TaxID=3483 RepID=A0A803NID3_CANSA
MGKGKTQLRRLDLMMCLRRSLKKWLLRKVVSIEKIDGLDSGCYNDYGWGKECFDMIIQSLKGKIDAGIRKVKQKEEDGGFYRLFNWPKMPKPKVPQLKMDNVNNFIFNRSLKEGDATLDFIKVKGKGMYGQDSKFVPNSSVEADFLSPSSSKTGTQFDDVLRTSENDDDMDVTRIEYEDLNSS